MCQYRLPPRLRSTVAVASVLLLTLAACGKSEGPRGSREKPYRIAVIPKGMTHEFWRTIHAGAISAQRELAGKGVHVELVWKGPLREDDREQQVQVVESFASQGIDGIVLAPLDEKALVRPVEEAGRLKVPTVIMDSALASEQIVSFVATDNYKGGQMGADALGQALGGKGRILLLRYAEGSASTTAREAGFLDQLKSSWPGLVLLSSDQYAGATRDTAKRAAENLLNRFGKDVQGMFIVNESSTAGMLLALAGRGARGQGQAGRLRRQPGVRGRHAQGRARGLRAPEPVPHGLARGHDAGRPPAGQGGAQADRHGRLRRDAGQRRRARDADADQAPARPVPQARGMTAVLRIAGIAKRFGATLALDSASLEVQPGEVQALVGENGAGKSTLLAIVSGLLQPDAGTLEVSGEPYAPRSPRDARARGIALIHQELSLFPHLTVAENVLMGDEPRRHGLWDRDGARRRTREVLAEFGHGEIDPDAKLGRLPIGARQVVEICRAIATRARVVLMDEPTSSLSRSDA